MKNSSNNQSAWNNWWATSLSKFLNKRSITKKNLEKILLNSLSANSKFLDLGCGTGHYSKVVCNHNITTHSLDFSIEALQLTEKNCNYKNHSIQLDILNDDVESLGKFDVILMDGLLEHFNTVDQKKILRKCKNLLNSDGKLISLVPHKYHFYQIIRVFIMKGIDEDAFTLDQYHNLVSSEFQNYQIKKMTFLPIIFDIKFLARILPMHLLLIATKN